MNSFNVLAGLDRTSLISPRRSSVLVARSNPQWRRKLGKVRYKSTEERTKHVRLLQAEGTAKLCQGLTGLVLEHAHSPATEDQDIANQSQCSTNTPFRFENYTPYGLKGSPIGPILPRRISIDARTKLAISTKVVMPAFHRGVTSENTSISICLQKTTFHSHVPALTIDAWSKRGSKAPWSTSICTQELGMTYPFACVAKNAVTAILSTSPSPGEERDRCRESFYQDMSNPLTFQRCSFPRLCHTAHFSTNRIMPQHEGLANSSFTDLQFTTGWAKCDRSATYKSPNPLLEPQSAFYYHQSGHLRKSSWAAGVRYFCRTLSNSVLMESLNPIRPPPTAALSIYAHQNCKVRHENFPFLLHAFGQSIPQTYNPHILRLGTMLTPGSTINGYRKSSLPQQVDSIFANRNPQVRRRLYSGPATSAKYPWLEKELETTPIDSANVSIPPVREELHSSSKGPSEDDGPDREWVRISRQDRKRSHLSMLSDTWHRSPSTSIDSSLPVLDSIPVDVEEPIRSVELNVESCGFEIMGYTDEDSDLESNEEYEFVQPNADDGGLEGWEAISALSARTSNYESDDEFSWEDARRNSSMKIEHAYSTATVCTPCCYSINPVERMK